MGLLALTVPNKGEGAKLVQLAEELAMGMRPATDIWRDHGIESREEAAKILAIPQVKTMIKDFRAEWASTNNISERIRVRSLMALEEGLLSLYQGAIDKTNPLNHRKDTMQFFARLAGLDKQSDVPANMLGAGGGGVSINIDLSNNGDERIVRINAGSVQQPEDAELIEETAK